MEQQSSDRTWQRQGSFTKTNLFGFNKINTKNWNYSFHLLKNILNFEHNFSSNVKKTSIRCFNITIVSLPILYVFIQGNWKSVGLIYDLWIDVNRKVSSSTSTYSKSGQMEHSFSKVGNWQGRRRLWHISYILWPEWWAKLNIEENIDVSVSNIGWPYSRSQANWFVVVGVEDGNIIKLIQLMIFGSEIVVINFDQELQQINHKNSKEIKNEAWLQWFWIVSRQSLFLSLNITIELCQKF